MIMSQSSAESNTEQGFRSKTILGLWLPVFICTVLLCLELYILLNDISSPTLHGRKVQGDPIAIFQNAKNNVQLKSFGTMIWGTPDEGQRLYQGDSIATLQTSEAIVSFSDQSEILVEPESLIIIEEAPKAETPGAERKIVARLMKGSIKRQKSSTTPLFIKFAQNATPVRFDDSKGDALFRIIHREYGIEVVVESGSVKLDLKQEIASHQSGKVQNTGGIEVVPLPKLPPPKLKKPKIEIQKSVSSFHSPIPLSFFFISEAIAEEVATVSVQFEWEPIEGADSYLIQISPTPEFKTIVVEQKTHELGYAFQTKAPENLTTYYFRVAAINTVGDVGEFSSIEKVDIRPIEQPQPKIEVVIPPPPVPAPVQPSPLPKPSLIEKPPRPQKPTPPTPAPVPSVQPKTVQDLGPVSSELEVDRSPVISSVRQFGFFENTVIQSGGSSFSPGIVWWPSFIRGTVDIGIGIDASLLRKNGGGGFFVGSNFVGHVGLMGIHWGIEGFGGLSEWFGYGGTALEYGLKIKRTVGIGFIDGLFLSYTDITALVPTQEIQLGIFFRL